MEIKLNVEELYNKTKFGINQAFYIWRIINR